MTATDRRSSPLDRRRDQASAAAAAAEKAQAGVTELDNRLHTNDTMAAQQKQALRNAEAEANRLKRSLKVIAKERERLTKDHRKAVARADKARAKAKDAEAKYEKIVLAEMVRREKERDRADSARPPVESTVGKALEPVANRTPVPARPDTAVAVPAGGRRRAPARPATGRGAPSGTDPAPEQPDPGTTTATRTAARKTAASAGSRTQRTRRTP